MREGHSGVRSIQKNCPYSVLSGEAPATLWRYISIGSAGLGHVNVPMCPIYWPELLVLWRWWTEPGKSPPNPENASLVAPSFEPGLKQLYQERVKYS